MRAYDIIQKKRDGKELTTEEIDFFVRGVTDGTVPDYQAAAFCMAVYFRGMTERETADLTFAIRDSGEKADFSAIKGLRADKHSTGGVGDKTSLIVAPIVASCGVNVAKISGRGLGHTGGTVDKLESIPGFSVTLNEKAFVSVVNDCGMAIIGQSGVFAPADKKLYAIRDVTATVDSIPLIAASIMGKKLASDDDCIVLDVKTGRGAFMKTERESEALARAMVDIGRRADKKICAVITDMDEPLGYAVGNALEVNEAVEVLQGKGEKRLVQLCIFLAAKMLFLAGKGDEEICLAKAENALRDGSALRTFVSFVKGQGGETGFATGVVPLPLSSIRKEIKATETGYLVRMNAEEIGKASLLLGAGRNTAEEKIDYGAGILLRKKVGDFVRRDETVAVLYTAEEKRIPDAEKRFAAALEYGAKKPEEKNIIRNVIG